MCIRDRFCEASQTRAIEASFTNQSVSVPRFPVRSSSVSYTHLAREQENLTHYMAQLENHYQDIRRFKHDYLNILSTITGYIQENDMDKLRNYFDSSIVTSSSILVNQDVYKRQSGKRTG